MKKVRTAQIDNKLFIMDGESPMRYVDLETNKVHVYPGKYMHFYFVVPVDPTLPKPQDILKACAKLQKAGADLSEMTIVHDKSDMRLFWIVSKKDLRRNNARAKNNHNQ